ncbi:hypothetical protein FACS1894101_2350 [Betaproteobacteria bacterium]|nr:hypothetical protein FACS1894101_2350 [Betaproteobacteria bacterium]
MSQDHKKTKPTKPEDKAKIAGASIFDAGNTGNKLTVIHSDEEEDDIGSIKFSGEAVLPGILDAGKAGMALTGFNEILRYFNVQQSSEFSDLEYEIPVKIQNGSWEAIVIASPLLMGVAGFLKSYLSRAGDEMAKRDFEGVGFRDIFRKSTQALVCFIKAVKHQSKLTGWNLNNLRWRNENKEVGIQNEKGEYLYLPQEFLHWYSSLPLRSINMLAEGIQENCDLIVSSKMDEAVIHEKITIYEKNIFINIEPKDIEEEFIFPELEHGKRVRLEGRVTRGNAKTNSFGLEYKEHILNCVPESGSIVRYKAALFVLCRVEGEVSRLDKHHAVLERKPTIIVHAVTPLESNEQLSLL